MTGFPFTKFDIFWVLEVEFLEGMEMACGLPTFGVITQIVPGQLRRPSVPSRVYLDIQLVSEG